MAFGIINNLISQPNVCRCCLSASGEWDITTSYLSADGKKEVYSEILKDCFGISVSVLATGNRFIITNSQCKRMVSLQLTYY